MNPTVQLLQFLLLTNFPSGSSINYHAEKLYLVGDDSRIVLVLDKNYQPVDSILLFKYPQKRIPKSEKVDLESSALFQIAGQTYLLALGSASTDERKKSLLISLTPDGLIDHDKPVVGYGLKVFVDRLHKAGIAEVNVEGAALKDHAMILANRGNNGYPHNDLVVTDENFWRHPEDVQIDIVSIKQPEDQGDFLGISELCYIKSRDMLLLALTSEATGNSYDDGIVGNSYLGWVNNFNKKLTQSELKLDGIINLSNVNELKNQKIEGLCLEREDNNQLVLHLISDNDNGETKLFKVLLKF